MEEVGTIRHLVLAEGWTIRRVARELRVSRNTIRRYLAGAEPGLRKQVVRARPVLGRVQARLDALLAEAHNRFGVVAPFGGPTSSGMITLHCPPMQLYALGSFLREHGADTVSIASLDYVLDRENPLFARLEVFLRQ